MTGRKVLFYKRDEEHMVKPSFSGAHQGIFHKWGVWQNVTVAIVESVEGTIFMTHPEFIRFAEKYGRKNPDKIRTAPGGKDRKDDSK